MNLFAPATQTDSTLAFEISDRGNLFIDGGSFSCVLTGREANELRKFLNRQHNNTANVRKFRHANCTSPSEGIHAIDCPSNPRYQS